MSPAIDPYDEDFYRDFIDDEEEEFEFDCHMGPSGQCGAAGSEDCEFECPYRREQRERRSRKAKLATMPLFPASSS